jgi:hypothetical protein
MERPESSEKVGNDFGVSKGGLRAEGLASSPAGGNPSPTEALSCPSCASLNNGTPNSYVYVIGRIEPRFPRISSEMEFAQATGRTKTDGLTDRQALQTVLSDRDNRYLVRQLCWVLVVEGVETYLLLPRDPVDFELLVSALRPTPRPSDLDVVIGVRGPIAPTEMCNGMLIPIVVFDQIYSFDRDSLFQNLVDSLEQKQQEKLPKEKKTKITNSAQELFDRIQVMADNAGATDEHRVLNYLTVRHPAVYTMVAEAFDRNSSLSAVEVRPSPLGGVRKVVDAIFSFTNRITDVVEKFAVRVDATDEFPFVLSKFSPYYDR